MSRGSRHPSTKAKAKMLTGESFTTHIIQSDIGYGFNLVLYHCGKQIIECFWTWFPPYLHLQYAYLSCVGGSLYNNIWYKNYCLLRQFWAGPNAVTVTIYTVLSKARCDAAMAAWAGFRVQITFCSGIYCLCQAWEETVNIWCTEGPAKVKKKSV